MDAQTRRAITLAYEASVETGHKLNALVELYDQQHAVLSSLHDLVLAEQSNVTPIRGAG